MNRTKTTESYDGPERRVRREQNLAAWASAIIGALALLGAVLSAVGSARAETATLGVRVDAVEKDGSELKAEIRQNYQAVREDVKAVNEKLDRLIERRNR